MYARIFYGANRMKDAEAGLLRIMEQDIKNKQYEIKAQKAVIELYRGRIQDLKKEIIECRDRTGQTRKRIEARYKIAKKADKKK